MMYRILTPARRFARRFLDQRADHAAQAANQRKLHQSSEKLIRWGILSTGRIAAKMARAIGLLDDAVVIAVGSRSAASAHAFGERFGIPHQHASYEALAADPDVDVIYVATPHNLHMENTLLCLQHGKAVLVEKPFALNAAQSQRMVDEARHQQLFLMEAMWTRFIPAIVKTRELLAQNILGNIQRVEATFSFAAPFDPNDRLFNLALAGGALLDVGIYPISFSAMVLGTDPTDIESHAQIGSTGVDEASWGVLRYANGAEAIWRAGLREKRPITATIFGEKGTLALPEPFHHPQSLTLHLHDSPPQTFALPYGDNGFEFQAAAVNAALRNGERESAVMPLDESIAIMKLLDAIRAPWGLVYPEEDRIPQ